MPEEIRYKLYELLISNYEVISRRIDEINLRPYGTRVYELEGK
ncbi:hypothetical protein [Caloramator quimbayensis]|nr:hypothetical protein [Caloramator quimbayensis]